ncbi:MAG: hypothetical protein ACTS6J_18505, partial [Burkholderiales bacterium]
MSRIYGDSRPRRSAIACGAALLGVLIGVMLSPLSNEAWAYKLRPTGTEDESRVVRLEGGTPAWLKSKTARWALDHFTNPVHQELTNRIWGCNAVFSEQGACVSWGGRVMPLIYGVQWNDNPPFAITATSDEHCRVSETIRLPDRQPECWLRLFYDAEQKSRGTVRYDRRSGKALIYRVHFGDMQFLHSMASWDGESMADTKKRILMWAEFAYKTAVGEIPPLTPVDKIPVAGFALLFRGNGYDVKTGLEHQISCSGCNLSRSTT